MPQKQHHRGKHPEDDRLFDARWLPVLRKAVADLSFLYGRGYSESAAAKLTGDHFQLDVRQRRAVRAAACGDAALERRRMHEAVAEDMADAVVAIDGYNLLIVVESALSGGVLFRGRDGCVRDLASVHGSYRRVDETFLAIHRIGYTLSRLEIRRALWYLDAPVSNSGRLKQYLSEEAAKSAWRWDIMTVINPDAVLASAEHIVATSDGWILDRAGKWFNLAAAVVRDLTPEPPILDIGAVE